MVESRIAMILQLHLAESSKEPLLTLVDGYPDPASLAAHFEEVPMILEANELSETLTDTPQGDVTEYQLRFRVGRESDFYSLWIQKRCIAAVELANGEKLLIGSQDYPLRYTYSRPIGAANGSESDVTLTFQTSVPVA